MLHEVVLTLKPFSAGDAIVSSETGEIFGCVRRFVSREMGWRTEIGVDLVEGSGGRISISIVRILDGWAIGLLWFVGHRSVVYQEWGMTRGRNRPFHALGFDATKGSHFGRYMIA